MGWQGRVSRQEPAAGRDLQRLGERVTGDEIKIAITNAAGTPVANLKAPAAAQGLTRLTWDLLPTKDVLTQYGGVDAKRLPPSGDYTAELTVGKTKVKQTFRVNVPEGIKTR